MIGKRTKLPLRTLLVCGGLGLALLAGAGVTAARYVMQNRQSGVMTAEEFYFTSDLLREPSETALYYIDPKAETFPSTCSIMPIHSGRPHKRLSTR